MLTGACIHPDLMRVLSLCGHGDKVLIADGNYPLASRSGGAEKVYLGLAPGLPTVNDACCEPGVRLAVSTGEGRTFANLLLTIGVADGTH